MRVKKEYLLKLISILQEKCNQASSLEEYIDISENNISIDSDILKESINHDDIEFVITVTPEIKEDLMALLSKFRLNLNWSDGQSLFYNSKGYKINKYKNFWGWNCDENNKYGGVTYKEICYNDLLRIVHKLKIDEQ